MNSQTASDCVVYVVDDDPAVGESLSQMLRLLGYATRTFTSAESLLESYQSDWTGCIVADLRLPGLDGIALQGALAEKGRNLPFVIVTGHGDVPAARKAFRERAIDFIEKPIDEEALLAAIETAMKKEALYSQGIEDNRATAERLARLTPREREVLSLVGKGLPAKEIAAKLGISHRTVEVHRTHILEKTGARNVSELVRLALVADRHPDNQQP